MTFYFAYGSNLWFKQMEKRCPDHKIIGLGVLRGWRWFISLRGFANIIRSQPDEVRGTVYEISESDQRNLDRYEGVRDGAYQKEMIVIEVNGQKLECLVYVDPTREEGKAGQEYMDRINRGLSDSHLPEEYVARYVRKFIPSN